MTFKKAVTILYSADINRSISYYVDVLCFDNSWVWDTPPTFGAVSKDNVEIFFCKEGQGNPGTWMSIFIDDVDAYYEKIKAKGAKITVEPTNREWGIREMLVEDPDGHQLRIGQNSLLSDKEIIAKALPANIRFVHRVPTKQEVYPVALSIGWATPGQDISDVSPSQAIAHAVVAENVDTDEVIGVVYALSDGEDFYYIKSMMVHRNWQHQRVGSAIMQEMVDWLEQNTKTEASIYLHTGEALNDFYRQFGFGPAFGMHRTIKKQKEKVELENEKKKE